MSSSSSPFLRSSPSPSSSSSELEEKKQPQQQQQQRRLTIGVFGGSFNPIHLGHALLAITTQQTKPVDGVVLVPVYKHAVKRDLLPFEDRVAMCKLAVSQSTGITVSTIERDVGESNGKMLRGLKKLYPPKTRFLWICGDDFFRWMERPKGLETIKEVDGLIVQRRLHHSTGKDDDHFHKEPLDQAKIRSLAASLNVDIDFIYGELPHFSSTLVRRAPGHWRSFLPQSIVQYLDERPHLLAQLHANLEADVAKETLTTTSTTTTPQEPKTKKAKTSQTTTTDMTTTSAKNLAAACVMRGLESVHALQMERGRTGLWLSMGTGETQLLEAQAVTDALMAEIAEMHIIPPNDDDNNNNTDMMMIMEEVLALDEELKQIPKWLQRDRLVIKQRAHELVDVGGEEGWALRLALLEKFNPRIDLLIGASIRALSEILRQAAAQHSSVSGSSSSREWTDLLFKWCDGKEALGRLRAFVSAGGPSCPDIVRSSLGMRERLHQMIETKERSIARVLTLHQASSSSSDTTRLAVPDALHKMLEAVTLEEWSLMGCFASSTPLALVHKLLAEKQQQTQTNGSSFDVEQFFEASSSAIDLMLSFVKALAAIGCARA